MLYTYNISIHSNILNINRKIINLIINYIKLILNDLIPPNLL